MNNFSPKAINNKKDKIMKKQYITPEMENILMDNDMQLLAGSLPIDGDADAIDPGTVDAPELTILLLSED